MDARVSSPPTPLKESPQKKLPASDRSSTPNILFATRDQAQRVFTDEVLRQAGFPVRSVPPSEAIGLIAGGLHAYSLIILSHTLLIDDIREIGILVRRLSPASKLLLLRGADNLRIDDSEYDSTLEGLDGPAALIREVQRLAGPPSSAPEGEYNGQASIPA